MIFSVLTKFNAKLKATIYYIIFPKKKGEKHEEEINQHVALHGGDREHARRMRKQCGGKHGTGCGVTGAGGGDGGTRCGSGSGGDSRRGGDNHTWHLAGGYADRRYRDA